MLSLEAQRLKAILFVIKVTRLIDQSASSYLHVDNNLICDCKLAWIWGLRNETKNTKLRDALEELTCFLESNNATQKINSEDLARNQPLPGKFCFTRERTRKYKCLSAKFISALCQKGKCKIYSI